MIKSGLVILSTSQFRASKYMLNCSKYIRLYSTRMWM